jgi:hypothetical protein
MCGGLRNVENMKITVEISERDLKDIIRFSGEKKKGPAIAKFLSTELMLRRRRELSDEVMSGKFRVEYPSWEKMRELDRAESMDHLIDSCVWIDHLRPRSSGGDPADR